MTDQDLMAEIVATLQFYGEAENYRKYATEPDWPHTGYTSKVIQDRNGQRARILLNRLLTKLDWETVGDSRIHPDHQEKV